MTTSLLEQLAQVLLLSPWLNGSVESFDRRLARSFHLYALIEKRNEISVPIGESLSIASVRDREAQEDPASGSTGSLWHQPKALVLSTLPRKLISVFNPFERFPSSIVALESLHECDASEVATVHRSAAFHESDSSSAVSYPW